MPIRRYFENYVFELSDFVSAARCDELVAFAERSGFEGATVRTPLGDMRRENIRNNDRVILDDQSLADELWTLAVPHVPSPFQNCKAVGLNERFRFYRYDPGQLFDWHQDGYFERDNGERSQFTFMIYLNDGCEGGGTSFHDERGALFEDFTVTPRKGTALFFYHPLVHRGDPIIAGRKYVLRSDMMFSTPLPRG